MNVLIEEGYGLGNATIKVVNTVKGTLYVSGQQAITGYTQYGPIKNGLCISFQQLNTTEAK